MSVTVSVGYLLLLAFFSVKPFSLIRFIEDETSNLLSFLLRCINGVPSENRTRS